MPRHPNLTLRVATSLAEIAPRDWDRLSQNETPWLLNRLNAEPDSRSSPGDSPSNNTESSPEHDDSLPEAPDSLSQKDPHNPFITHAFLSSIEEAGCIGGKTGWHPRYLLAEDETSTLVGAVPAFLKTHSRGEYVFDHAFAEALHRAGGAYYPKLQISVPFTPATGPRLLVADDKTADDKTAPAIRAMLIAGLRSLCMNAKASSIHATFLMPEDLNAFTEAGFLTRADQQFHFVNRGYPDFNAVLDALPSRKRKVLKRERKDALANGISVEWFTGAAITKAHWDAFFAFYQDTGSRKWGTPYLNRAFFSRIQASMAERILLVLAFREGRAIAGALNFIGGNTLYGRHWGAIEHHPFLHFELCYYQAIDFALAHGLARVEAGAQGEHKLARGYRPVTTWSAHAFMHEGLHRAVADFLEEERVAVERAGQELAALLPFKEP